MLVWNDNLSVNVLEIDNQHKEMFKNLNCFLEALALNVNAKATEDLFLFLDQFIASPFNHEERIMDKYIIYDYPDFAKHKSEHAGFKKDFAEFQTDMIKNEISAQLANEFKKWITNWWFIHIGKVDKGLGDFIRRVILF